MPVFAIQERAISENPAAGPDGIGDQSDLAYTLEARATAQAVSYRTSGNCGAWDTGSTTDALTTSTDPNAHVIVEPFTLAIRGRDDGHDLEFRQDGIANAILTPNGGRAGIGVGAIAFSSKDHGGDAGDLSPTLRSGAHADSHANSGARLP